MDLQLCFIDLQLCFIDVQLCFTPLCFYQGVPWVWDIWEDQLITVATPDL